MVSMDVCNTYDDSRQNAFETFAFLFGRFVTLQNARYVRSKHTFVRVQFTQFLVQPHSKIGRHFCGASTGLSECVKTTTTFFLLLLLAFIRYA